MKRYNFDQLVFASTPSRMVDRTDEIMQFVSKKGKACLHPFNAMPYEYYEGGELGRDYTLDVCHRLIAACDELWVFGASDGTMFEIEEFIKNNARRSKPQQFRNYVKEFDPKWHEYLRAYAMKYPAAAALLAGESLSASLSSMR